MDNCKVMHTGRNNLNYLYTPVNSRLTVTIQGKKDLGVIVDNIVKPICLMHRNGQKSIHGGRLY